MCNFVGVSKVGLGDFLIVVSLCFFFKSLSLGAVKVMVMMMVVVEALLSNFLV